MSDEDMASDEEETDEEEETDDQERLDNEPQPVTQRPTRLSLGLPLAPQVHEFHVAYLNSREDAHISFQTASSLCPGVECPILHTSVRNIYMLQPSEAPRQTERPSPSRPAEISHLPAIMIADPWHQAIHHQRGSDLQYVERCCMHAQVPSLGIVIVGNQKGRVAILSLRKSRRELDIAIKGRKNEPVNVKGQKLVYSMELVYMLPFASQERAGNRPMAALHGIAVSPVQGSSVADGGGRWRLLIMYQDHTVLSYEIARARNSESVKVQDVMI